jgi:hypothetical protein
MFSPKNSVGWHTYAYIPFGIGCRLRVGYVTSVDFYQNSRFVFPNHCDLFMYRLRNIKIQQIQLRFCCHLGKPSITTVVQLTFQHKSY